MRVLCVLPASVCAVCVVIVLSTCSVLRVRVQQCAKDSAQHTEPATDWLSDNDCQSAKRVLPLLTHRWHNCKEGQSVRDQ